MPYLRYIPKAIIIFALLALAFRSEIPSDIITATADTAKVSLISLEESALPLAPKPDVPVLTGVQSLPSGLTSLSAIVLDPISDSVLYSKNPDDLRYPASTTKIMTALIALDQYRLDEFVHITNAHRAKGHSAELWAGEIFTVEDLLYAMMVPSGNDAAVALAEHHPQGYAHFVSLMNQKALQLKLHHTHYTNVSGIEDKDHYSSARDLAYLAKYALENPHFQKIVATQRTTVASMTGNQVLNLTNLNQLLWTVPGVIGVKTGWTQRAGDCLVTAVVRDGRHLITVVLGSQNRFHDSTQLIEWAYANHTWIDSPDQISFIDPSD